jgi:hypothetical protein
MTVVLSLCRFFVLGSSSRACRSSSPALRFATLQPAGEWSFRRHPPLYSWCPRSAAARILVRGVPNQPNFTSGGVPKSSVATQQMQSMQVCSKFKACWRPTAALCRDRNACLGFQNRCRRHFVHERSNRYKKAIWSMGSPCNALRWVCQLQFS